MRLPLNVLDILRLIWMTEAADFMTWWRHPIKYSSRLNNAFLSRWVNVSSFPLRGSIKFNILASCRLALAGTGCTGWHWLQWFTPLLPSRYLQLFCLLATPQTVLSFTFTWGLHDNCHDHYRSISQFHLLVDVSIADKYCLFSAIVQC